MRANIFIYLSLAFVISISGCTAPFNQGSEKTTVLSNELLRINHIDISPDTTVNSGTTLYIEMEVENVGQSDVNLFLDKKPDGTSGDEANNCDYTGRDSNSGDGGVSENKKEGRLLFYSYCDPLYQIKSFEILSYTDKDRFVEEKADINYDGKKESVCALKLEPGETAVFRWEVKTPSEKDTFGMIHECNFGFQAMYKAEANTTAYIYFANVEELRQRQYNQQDMSLAGNNIATAGPVAAIVVAENQPYPVDENDGSFTFTVRLENRGKGIARVLNMKIRYPNGFTKTQNCPYFSEGTGGSGNSVLTISKDASSYLKIYGGKSSMFYCEFIVPEVKILTPYRFDVWAEYIYALTEEKKIKVVPFSKA